MRLIDAPLSHISSDTTWINFWLDMRQFDDPETKMWTRRAEAELKQRGIDPLALLHERKAWDENEHPRDEAGKFTDAGGGEEFGAEDLAVMFPDRLADIPGGKEVSDILKQVGFNEASIDDVPPEDVHDHKITLPKQVHSDIAEVAMGMAAAVKLTRGTFLEKAADAMMKTGVLVADYEPVKASMSTQTSEGQSRLIINNAHTPYQFTGDGFSYSGKIGKWTAAASGREKGIQEESKFALVHEFAHVLDHMMDRKLTDSMFEALSSYGLKNSGEAQRFARDNISPYAAASPSEATAEAICKYMADGKLPPPLDNWIKDVVAGRPLKTVWDRALQTKSLWHDFYPDDPLPPDDELTWQQLFERKAWDESEHPRDEHGRWTDAGGGEDGSGFENVAGGGKELPHVSAQQAIREAREGVARASAQKYKQPRLEGNSGHPALISTRQTGARSSIDSEKVYARIDMAAMRSAPEHHARALEVFSNARLYPYLRKSEVTGNAEAVTESIIAHLQSNMEFVYRQANRQDLEAAIWYPGARRIIDDLVIKHGVNDASAAGAIAVMSPLRDSDENFYVARRLIEIYTGEKNTPWDDAMTKVANRLRDNPDFSGSPRSAQNVAALNAVRGNKLSQLTNDTQKAVWIRIFDEAHNSVPDEAKGAGSDDRVLPFRHVNKDGSLGDWVRRDDGSRASAAWHILNRATAAIKILDANGDRKIISNLLRGNKVRSFYNNMLDPFSKNKDVTNDTHTVGAGWLMPFAARAVPVAHSMGNTPKKTSQPVDWMPIGKTDGIIGTYPFYAEAMQRAAGKLKIEPNAFEAVVWTVKRNVFGKLKNGAEAHIRSLWEKYRDGKASLQTTQKAVWQYAQSDGHA